MSMAFWQRLAILALFSLSAGSLSSSVQAAQFEQQEIDQSRFIVLAAPGGEIGYKLLILEQLNDNRPCWSETGTSPSNVEPLLLSFDFTGICNRIVDSNGFSVRTAGEDQGLQYSLRILQQDGDLVLVAASNTQRNTYVEIGRTNGMPAGFSRIVLHPGWRLTRRAFNGRPVGHVYLTYDQPIETLLAASPRNGATFRQPSTILQPPNPTSSGTPELPGVIPVPSLPPTPSNTEVPPRSESRPVLPSPQVRNSGGPSVVLPPPPETAPNPVTPTAGSASSSGGTAIATNSSAGTSSNGRLLPPSLRRTVSDSATSDSSTSDSATSDSATSGSTNRQTSSSTSNPSRRQTTTSAATNSPSHRSANRTNSEASTTIAQAETYQVVVVADSAETQDKVRSVAPNAFLTTINGQVVMQVGIFRNRQDADQLQQRLSLEGLPTAVIPVR